MISSLEIFLIMVVIKGMAKGLCIAQEILDRKTLIQAFGQYV